MSATSWEEDFAADEPHPATAEPGSKTDEPKPWELPGGRGYMWEVSFDDGKPRRR
jgi:hypothetical protein